MAKTAAEYITEGRALYASSKDKTQPHAHPKSWQQKAVNQGFMEAFAEEADEQATQRAGECTLCKAEATAGAVLKAEMIPVKAVNLDTDEVVHLRLPKKTVEQLSRLAPPNSMMHAFTDTPPMVVMRHVNALVIERSTETDSVRRSRLLASINRIVDRWNKKATLARINSDRLLNRAGRVSKLGMGLTKEIYEGLGFGS